VAAGTGDLAIEIASRGGDVVGSDFSEGMLDRARKKAPGLTWEQADATALPYGDDTFDAATVGFGARNFGDLPQGLREMVRVVKPGGRVVILEITTPQKPPLSTFFSIRDPDGFLIELIDLPGGARSLSELVVAHLDHSKD